MKKLLKKFKMDEAKVINTPIATATKLDLNEIGQSVEEKLYKGMIGHSCILLQVNLI